MIYLIFSREAFAAEANHHSMLQVADKGAILFQEAFLRHTSRSNNNIDQQKLLLQQQGNEHQFVPLIKAIVLYQLANECSMQDVVLARNALLQVR